MDYLQIAGRAVDIAQSIGGHAAEAYVLDAKSLTVEVANQEIETLKLSEEMGIGIRLFSRQGTVGFAYSTSLDNLEALARQALDNSRNSHADKFNVLPEKPQNIPEMKLLDEKIAATSVEEKINMAKQVELAARQADKRVKRTERCVYEDAEYGVALANSQGLAAYYRSGYAGLYGMVLAEEDGDVQSGMSLNYTRDFAALDPKIVGEEAARDAGLLLKAKSVATTKATLLLSPYIATSFFAILIPALSADAVQKGRSLFKGKVGQKVVSPLVTLIDDGRLHSGIASRPVDGEGVPTGQTELIVNGVLQGFLHNTYTAAKDDVASTGNGMRSTFKSMPEVGPTNLFIHSGTARRDELISGIKNGFYVTNVMGMHTANPISGDFSVGAAGVWIKDGQFTQAVRGVAIAGNILELFSQVDGIGDDLRFFGAQGAPSMRISNITVSGQ